MSGSNLLLMSGPFAANTKTVQIKVWGAGGGAGNYGDSDGEWGGPGGYATATFSIAEGTVLSIFVGQGGGIKTTGGNPNGGYGASTNGTRDGSGFGSGVGGGFCGVFVGSYNWAALQAASIPSSNALIIAGSGGGGSYYLNGNGGGYGGGTTGGDGFNRTSSDSPIQMNGYGGTATAGGATGTTGTPFATAGSLYKGGNSSIDESQGTAGGGGGAGWYGGGGSTARYTPTGYTNGYGGGGGGGSGMIASITAGTSLPTGVVSVTGNNFITQTGTGVSAPNTSDPDYPGGVAEGGAYQAGHLTGNNGFVAIIVNGVKYTYSYQGSSETLTV